MRTCLEEEFSLREDRLLANVSDLIETNHRETINVVRNALNENSVAVENSIQSNHKVCSPICTSLAHMRFGCVHI